MRRRRRKISGLESVVMIKGGATRGTLDVVVGYASVVPIKAPMTPAPGVIVKKGDYAGRSEIAAESVIPDTGIWGPVRPCINRSPIGEPWIILRNVNRIGVGRLNRDV